MKADEVTLAPLAEAVIVLSLVGQIAVHPWVISASFRNPLEPV
jgi:hypothetical protein